METDLRTLEPGTRLEADVCIIGAGPAGLTVAGELAGGARSVLVLESGGRSLESETRELGAATIAGDAIADPRDTRARGAGGTALLWNTPVDGAPGAKYAPLDACDFETRPDGFGWPFGRSVLEPFYRRAQAVCGLGRFAWEASDWPDPRTPVMPLAGDHVTTRVYQFGPADVFTKRNLGRATGADNVRLCTHATVVALVLDRVGDHIAAVRVADPEGRSHEVRAAIFVLAAGALENARLLLASATLDPRAPWCRAPWLGRGFMEHPRDHALRLVPRSPDLFRLAACHDIRRTNGGFVGGRLALTDAAVRTDLPNASATLFPRARRTGWPARLRPRIRKGPIVGYGWSRLSNPGDRFRDFRLIVNLEQRPHADNHVALGAQTDALGMPRLVIHWRWRDHEQQTLRRLRRVFADALERAGHGRVEIDDDLHPDPNAHHHAGTTRMSDDPSGGVVDPHGRVHGVDNLYVTGASVFPTAGFANPTLTVVAMAVRLGQRLGPRPHQPRT